MANQSNYYQRPRTYMSSLPSLNSTESGHFHGHAREMRPPLPPQPMEIADLSISRTLPSPTATAASSNLDLLPPPGHGYGEMPYGSNPNIAKIYQQFPTDGQIMHPAPQDPIRNWYDTNDGPWTHIPKVMPPNVISDGRFQSKQTSSRNHISSGGQYRPQNPSESGSFHFGVPHSDSGYGTRRSVTNTSVFSGDVPERDQDCQSLTGQVENYNPFIGSNDNMQRDPIWNPSVSSIPESRGMECPTCHKPVKTQSEMKKHELRHTKPFQCDVQGCSRTEGFSTPNDLDRHKKSLHSETIISSTPMKKYRCLVVGCKVKEKTWPRLDNFKSHLKRVHQSDSWIEEAIDSMVKRGEFYEQAGHPVEEISVEKHTLPDLAQPAAAFTLQDMNRPRTSSAWTPYPKAIEPAHDLVAPTGPQAGFHESRTATTEERSPILEAPPQAIVKPGDVLRNYVPEVTSLDRSSLVPAGHDESAVSKPDQAKSHAASKTSPQGKATRQTNVSATATTITEALKTVLSELELSDISHDAPSSSAGNKERTSQPNKENSSRLTDPNPGTHDSDISPPPSKETKDSLNEKKALEFLKIISKLGFSVSKDPAHPSQKQHNVGSAASQRSENQVTCQTCKKFTGRPCELKKHMKRHSKPYGCTFPTCSKAFGSKNDWKRHENSQHFHLDTWRCCLNTPSPSQSHLHNISSSSSNNLSPTPCTKVFYRRLTFSEHLRKEHSISDESVVKSTTEKCRIGRNCQARFWCGFCGTSVELKGKGLEAWTERFDHVDDHFMGRNEGGRVWRINEWVPVDGSVMVGKEKSESGSSGDEGNGSGSREGESAATAVNLDSASSNSVVGVKRRVAATPSSENPPKRTKTTTFEEVIICCECQMPHNPKLHSSCSSCDNSHRWCPSCKESVAKVGPDLG